MLKRIIYFFLSVICSSPIFASEKSTLFSKIVNEYFDSYYFPMNPTLSTQLGNHSYDDQIEDYSKKGIDKRISRLKDLEKQLVQLTPQGLDEWGQNDYNLLLNHIRSRLLTLEVIKPWEKNPDYYSGNISNSAFAILGREYAPIEVRLANLIKREEMMPGILENARNNLKNPPKIYTEIALEQLPAIIRFFQKNIPSAFVDVKDEALLERFNKSNAAVINALIDYQNWLKTVVLPNSNGDYRIGAATYQQKLSYDEMVDLPLEQLLALNQDNMNENQRKFLAIARELDNSKSPQELLSAQSGEAVSNNLLLSFKQQFEQLIAFINAKNIVTIPESPYPEMQETPAFMRATTSASMDTPGPYEQVKTAYFNVTLPNPAWDQKSKDDFMRGFPVQRIVVTSIHETYPGHYVQFLHVNNIQDKIRKTLGASSNSEGWAHYCEQMMLDEGFGSDLGVSSENYKLLQLNQLSKALLRNARFVVGIKLHTGEMTFDEAVNFFMTEAYQFKTTAVLETKRATMDPTYIYYTLGKLQILKLRADLEKKQGTEFNLKKFHDAFLSYGTPPIKMIRKALLHDDSPVL